MVARTQAESHEAGVAPSTLLTAVAGLIVLLVLTQALLAGEWLVGKSTIGVHGVIGFAILLLALAQVGVCAATVHTSARRLTIASTGVFAALVLAQMVLGVSGYNNGGQARALHISNGVLLMGLAVLNVVLARRR